jgi:hypothetical protein
MDIEADSNTQNKLNRDGRMERLLPVFRLSSAQLMLVLLGCSVVLVAGHFF